MTVSQRVSGHFPGSNEHTDPMCRDTFRRVVSGPFTEGGGGAVLVSMIILLWHSMAAVQDLQEAMGRGLPTPDCVDDNITMHNIDGCSAGSSAD